MSGSWYRHRPTPAVPLHGPQPGDASEDRVARPVITVDAGPQFTVLAVADSNADSNELNRARTTPTDDGRPPEVRDTDGRRRTDDSRRRSGGFCLRLAPSRTERWARRGHMTAERCQEPAGNVGSWFQQVKGRIARSAQVTRLRGSLPRQVAGIPGLTCGRARLERPETTIMPPPCRPGRCAVDRDGGDGRVDRPRLRSRWSAASGCRPGR
jgi:hypothetical protein